MLAGHGNGPRSEEKSSGLELNKSNNTTFIQGTGPMIRGELNGPGLSKTRHFSKDKTYGPLRWAHATYSQILQNDQSSNGRKATGVAGRQNLKGHLARIKPKSSRPFIHGNIFSSQMSSSPERNRNFGSCTLRVSGSLVSTDMEYNNNFCSTQHWERSNLCGLANLTCANLEATFDGEPPRAIMLVTSSSEDEFTDGREETNYQNSETFEKSQEDQTVGLEDIKALFNEDQELPINTVEVSNCHSNFFLQSRYFQP